MDSDKWHFAAKRVAPAQHLRKGVNGLERQLRVSWVEIKACLGKRSHHQHHIWSAMLAGLPEHNDIPWDVALVSHVDGGFNPRTGQASWAWSLCGPEEVALAEGAASLSLDLGCYFSGAVNTGNDVAEAFGVLDAARFFRRNLPAIARKLPGCGPLGF